MAAVRVGIAQLNALVGDLAGNARMVLEVAHKAYQQGARVLLTPELVLTGYPPEDLLLRPAFIEQCESTLQTLCAELSVLKGLHVVVGHACKDQDGLRNAASVLSNGQILGTYFKKELPNYSVFDEKRYFVSGGKPLSFNVDGVRFGVNICEDIWGDSAPEAAAALNIQALLVLNASPFSLGKQAQRVRVALRCVERTHCALIYANLAGGQDELVFDGASFALSREGQLALRAADFATDLSFIEVLDSGEVSVPVIDSKPLKTTPRTELLSEEAQVWEALKLCLTDYVAKNGFKSVILGLSGGIDSAVVMAVAVDALGADHVHAVMMPSRYTADISQIDARDMAKRLGVAYREIAIAELANSFDLLLAPIFAGRAPDATEENIQARLRGMLLMALSNKFGHLVLTTGNKSELSTGYCTLYGDMAGGFAVLKDVAKTLVYRLARWRNTFGEVIPVRIITRPPSAELREDQTDQDNLPEYEVIDAIIEHYVERNASPAEIIAAGYAPEAVEQILRLIRINEYKRKQGPFGPRITERAFGRDWRYPLSNGFRN
ncbi:NAD+ synthase [Zwartia sp.]|uniref:NAD+ synthase n=1 Tax=Zwartia sp. TaxID=2978004 RepID=UPI003BB010A5